MSIIQILLVRNRERIATTAMATACTVAECQRRNNKIGFNLSVKYPAGTLRWCK